MKFDDPFLDSLHEDIMEVTAFLGSQDPEGARKFTIQLERVSYLLETLSLSEAKVDAGRVRGLLTKSEALKEELAKQARDSATSASDSRPLFRYAGRLGETNARLRTLLDREAVH